MGNHFSLQRTNHVKGEGSYLRLRRVISSSLLTCGRMSSDGSALVNFGFVTLAGVATLAGLLWSLEKKPHSKTVAEFLVKVPQLPSRRRAAAVAGTLCTIGIMLVLRDYLPAAYMPPFMRKTCRMFIRMAFVAGIGGAGIVVFLWYFQERLLFHPHTPKGYETADKNPDPYKHPGQMSMSYEDVMIPTKDGIKIHAWLIKQKSPLDYTSAPTLIYFQGNAGNMGFRLPNHHKLYHSCQVNILAVSYRGYGNSEGTPTEPGVYIDAEAALDYLLSRNDIDHDKLFVFGRSVGGAVAIDLGLKRQRQLRGVIVENTFTNIKEMVEVVFPVVQPFMGLLPLVQRLNLNSLEKVKLIRIPILFISGLRDTLVPPAHMAQLHAAATSSVLKSLLEIAGGTHNDTWQSSSEYYVEFSKFMADSLEQPRCEADVATPKRGGLPSPTSFSEEETCPKTSEELRSGAELRERVAK